MLAHTRTRARTHMGLRPPTLSRLWRRPCTVTPPTCSRSTGHSRTSARRARCRPRCPSSTPTARGRPTRRRPPSACSTPTTLERSSRWVVLSPLPSPPRGDSGPCACHACAMRVPCLVLGDRGPQAQATGRAEWPDPAGPVPAARSHLGEERRAPHRRAVRAVQLRRGTRCACPSSPIPIRPHPRPPWEPCTHGMRQRAWTPAPAPYPRPPTPSPHLLLHYLHRPFPPPSRQAATGPGRNQRSADPPQSYPTPTVLTATYLRPL